MKLWLHPAAERDVAEAAAFYEQEASAVLAARFVKEFKRIGSLLLEYPEIGAPRSGERRSFGMQVFPYSVVYRVREDRDRSAPAAA